MFDVFHVGGHELQTELLLGLGGHEVTELVKSIFHVSLTCCLSFCVRLALGLRPLKKNQELVPFWAFVSVEMGPFVGSGAQFRNMGTLSCAPFLGKSKKHESVFVKNP